MFKAKNKIDKISRIRGAFVAGGISFLKDITRPKSKKEDIKRKEFIFNIIILFSICIAGLFSFFVFYRFFFDNNSAHDGISFLKSFLIFLFLVFLYFLSRRGFFRPSSYFLVAIYFFFSSYTVYRWGADVPQASLTYALVVVISGVLVGTKFSILVALFSSIVLVFLGYAQINNIIPISTNWKKEIFTMTNIIEHCIILFSITIVSWLSNREIEKSLKRARKSEKELKKERDSLEIKVKERTKELELVQLDKVKQLYRFAEFGKLSSGLFHDLSNHLTSFFLNLEKLSPKEEKDKTVEAKKYLIQARAVMHKTEDFIEAVQKQLRREKNLRYFSLNKEIKQVIQIFHYKAREEGVEIKFISKENIITYGNLIRFNQIITNLVSNAIDAYKDVNCRKDKKLVVVKLERKCKMIFISVRDFGCGIDDELKEKIFDPFFTTKKMGHGIGIGLSSTKDIIRKNFYGEIDIKSQKGKGSEFIIKFPIKNAKNKN